MIQISNISCASGNTPAAYAGFGNNRPALYDDFPDEESRLGRGHGHKRFGGSDRHMGRYVRRYADGTAHIQHTAYSGHSARSTVAAVRVAVKARRLDKARRHETA